MSEVTVAVIQMQCTADVQQNMRTAERLVRQAAEQGGQVILLPELFERQYFCQERRYEYYNYALPTEDNPAVRAMQSLAGELGLVIVVSFYERAQNTLYNSAAVVDADGSGRHISRTIIFIRKNFILHRETPDLPYGIQDMAGLGSGSAGISGSRRRPDAWL